LAGGAARLAAGAPGGGFALDVVWSILGAILLLLVIVLARGAGRRRVIISPRPARGCGWPTAAALAPRLGRRLPDAGSGWKNRR
jgi:hypothetical protein